MLNFHYNPERVDEMLLPLVAGVALILLAMCLFLGCKSRKALHTNGKHDTESEEYKATAESLRAELEKSRAENESLRSRLEKSLAAYESLRAELDSLKSRKYIAGPSAIEITSSDDEFMQKALQVIENNIDNTEYDVDSFVSDMALGRTVLYSRIKELTGMSINEFITDIRLKRARQLLLATSLTISEISFKTGFSSPKYFSSCCKKYYGLTPSELRMKSEQ